MMPKKGRIAIVVMLLVFAALANKNLGTSTNENNYGKDASSQVVATSLAANSKDQKSKVKTETITDKDIIKKNVPLKKNKPTINLKDLKEADTYAIHEPANADTSKNDNGIYRMITNYQSPSGQTLILIQATLPEGIDASSVLSNIENKTGTAKVKGVDAAICEVNGGYTQITFVKDNTFYNVVGFKLDKKDLIKIAESLQPEV